MQLEDVAKLMPRIEIEFHNKKERYAAKLSTPDGNLALAQHLVPGFKLLDVFNGPKMKQVTKLLVVLISSIIVCLCVIVLARYSLNSR